MPTEALNDIEAVEASVELAAEPAAPPYASAAGHRLRPHQDRGRVWPLGRGQNAAPSRLCRGVIRGSSMTTPLLVAIAFIVALIAGFAVTFACVAASVSLRRRWRRYRRRQQRAMEDEVSSVGRHR
jgi:hypothetical protein